MKGVVGWVAQGVACVAAVFAAKGVWLACAMEYLCQTDALWRALVALVGVVAPLMVFACVVAFGVTVREAILGRLP